MPIREPYRPRPPAREFEEIRRQNPHWPQVLAEGDSWFAHPTEWNILFHLLDRGGFAIRRLASVGDELAEMLNDVGGRTPQYLKKLQSRRFRWRALLFSGGGNDLLGKPLKPMLRDRREVSHWRDCLIDQVLDAELAKLRSLFEELIEQTDQERPGLPILVHGYDYPFPRDKGATLFWGALTVTGPWMYPVMKDKRHIEDREEQRKLVSILIDRLNDEVLAGLDADHASFHHIDLRGTLPSVRQWSDEIHPKSSGFKRMARAYRRKLVELLA